MTLLLIAGGWLVAAALTAGLFALLARAGRGSETDPPPAPVQVPRQRTATADAPSLEGSH